MKVGNVMTTSVVTVSEDTPFKEVVRVMQEHAVSGVPVVDGQGRLVGIVTEADLLMAEEPGARRRGLSERILRTRRRAEQAAGLEDVRAGDIMNRPVVTVAPDLSVREAIRVLLHAGVKRLPVIDAERRVAGIVSRADLLSVFLRPDAEIAGEISDRVIYRTMWIDPATIDVRVSEGLVRLSGQVERRSVKEILLELVERVDGVVAVEDRLSYAWDDRKVRPEAPSGAPIWSENWVSRRPISHR